MPFVPDAQSSAQSGFVPDAPAKKPSVDRATAEKMVQDAMAANRNPLTRIKDAMYAVPEAVMNMASGMVAAPASDVAGLAKMGKEMAAPSGGDPQALKQGVQRRLTYEPQSPEARAVAEYNPLALLGKGVGAVAHGAGNLVKGDNPGPIREAAGNFVEEVLRQAPGLLGAKFGAKSVESVPKVQAGLDIEKGLNAPRDAIRNSAQQAGLTTPPEGTSWVSGIPGLGKVDKWISSENAPKFNRLVAENFGLKKGVALTPEELNRIRDEKSSAYRAVIAAGEDMKHAVPMVSAPSKLLDASGKPLSSPPKLVSKSGFSSDDTFKSGIQSQIDDIKAQQAELPETFKSFDPAIKLLSDYAQKEVYTPATTVRAIRQLRKDAGTEFKSDDPSRIASAFTKKQIANSLEDMIERNLEKSGQTQLLKDYKEARQTIAQTYDVESALDSTGNINARKLHLIAQKKPLSGNLKIVADYAGAFPEGAQKVASGKQAISPWDWMFGAGSMAAGHPGVAALEMAGRVGVPMLAQKGLLQKKTPNYMATNRLGNALPPAGIALSSEANQ